EMADRLGRGLRLEHAVRLGIAIREALPPVLELTQPWSAIGSHVCGRGSNLCGELRQRELERPDDRDLRMADLPDLGRIDVEMDHFRARCERRHLAGDA